MKKHNGKLVVEKGSSLEAQQDVLQAHLKEQRDAKREEQKQEFLKEQQYKALKAVLDGVKEGVFTSVHQAIYQIAGMKDVNGKPVFYIGFRRLSEAYNEWENSLNVAARLKWMKEHNLENLEKSIITTVEPSKRDFPPAEDAPRPDNGMSPYSHSCHDYQDPDQD